LLVEFDVEIPVATDHAVRFVPVDAVRRLVLSAVAPPLLTQLVPFHQKLSLLRRMAYLTVLTPLDAPFTVGSLAPPLNVLGTLLPASVAAFTGAVIVEAGAVESTVNWM
jgi:hypothetical protein